MQPAGTVYDPTWDLRAYSGWSPSLGAIVVAFRRVTGACPCSRGCAQALLAQHQASSSQT